MYCPHCGTEVRAQANVCHRCGTNLRQVLDNTPAGKGPQPPPATPSQSPSAAGSQFSTAARAEVAQTVNMASRDALQAFRTFMRNPVGGLSASFERLGPQQATAVAIVFLAVFDVMVVVGIYMLVRSALGPYLSLAEEFGSSVIDGTTVFKLLLSGLVPFISLIAASAAARMIFRGRGSYVGDAFIGGAALLPTGIAVLLSGFLGIANLEVIAALIVFALCYTVLILYSGCTKISGLSEDAAAIAVPVMVLISVWLSKIIFTAVIS